MPRRDDESVTVEERAANAPSRIRVARDHTTFAAVLAVLVAQLCLAIPAVLIGLFQADLGTTSAELTWIADVVMLPMALLELSAGVLGDLFGRKRLLVIGGLLVALGGAISMLTPGAGASTTSRTLELCTGLVLTGMGAAALFATSLAVVATRDGSDQARARSVALWAVALASGGGVSPLIGGLTGAHPWFSGQPDSGWRWTFLAVVVLGVLTAAVSHLLARESRAPEGRSLDWRGQATIVAALGALLFAVIQGPTSGWGSVEVVAGFVAAAVLLPIFVLVEARHPRPLLLMRLFTNRTYAASALACTVGMFAFAGTGYATAARLAAVQGLGPLDTAVALVLPSAMALLLIKVTSALSVHVDPRWVLGTGLALIGAGDIFLFEISRGSLTLLGVIAPIAIVGVGFAFAISSITEAAVKNVPAGLAGMASASNNMLRNTGFTLGPAGIAAVSLTLASDRLHAKIAATASLRHALAKFDALPAHASAAQRVSLRAAVAEVHSGPLGANTVPATIVEHGRTVLFNPLKAIDFHLLAQSYATGFLICATAAFVAALIALFFMGARSKRVIGHDEREGGRRGLIARTRRNAGAACATRGSAVRSGAHRPNRSTIAP